jgi:RND family efflux transporter MFP subunit
LVEAIANAERSNKLIASGFMSAQQASQTNAAEQTARARVAIQKAKLEASLVRLDQAKIVAPDSGIVSASNVAVGSLTQNNTELFRLIRQGKLEWYAELTAEDLAQVKKGMPVSVTLADGQVIHGKVRAVSPSVNIQTRHGLAIVRFADEVNLVGGLFARGMFDVSGGTKAVQTLPQSALMQRGSQTFVLIVGADKRVHERQVSIGQRQANQVEIKAGLKSTEPVVESGGAFLTEGDVVLVVKG